ncbi:GNAT family N-acetyltransferase [Arthrobacter cryoconiti]|uniref:GNAT family N-acetyltransferase n=1 Tax=Arthrobacter cryoconiti TaxID=748907 RepID=A0ABV8QW96_9MICC|nr:GNAT family N-acetyltransferase [Arthrobacter cryoconiti]MCC9069897.1 GNAT family N-acetyltransferase [Arthrobacter cryoconiti]
MPQTREMLCLFPTDITEAGLRPALAEAERRGAATIGIWLNASVREGILPAHRFKRGWQPWWMTCALNAQTLARASSSPDERVELTTEVAGSMWSAAAHCNGEWLGQASSYQPPDQNGKHLAGIFDMVVAPEHRRTGVGTSLLNVLVAAAFDAGAEHLVLNATAEGEKLYSNYGFELVGKGQTWWINR